MDTTELLTLLRSEVSDQELPYLWSDALLYSYIDDAQKQFCRDTYGIADARSFTIDIVPGTEWYPLDRKILKIRSAVDSVTGRETRLVPMERAESEAMRFDGRQGPLRALVSGMEANTLRTWPVPNQASTIALRTFRLPATVGAGDELEIDELHHPHLLNWVKHRAYGVQDTEVFDKQASERFRAAHKAYCADALIAQSRAAHSAGNVVYGGN